uniref:Interferon gamma receptor 1 n=1 Tax=Monopterus albus TaxID=43700 RepID=A0A3Q3QH11_MONAL|nr:interferon gamma receptor 1 precursor [Monopterus albus]
MMLAAVLLVAGVSAGLVPPPTNVTVTCQNLKTVVRWKYNSAHQPQTNFTVHLVGSEGDNWSRGETTDLQYDLSPFIWESDVLDFYYVTITAIQGGSRSELVRSDSFSFNRLKPAHVKCTLDFPPVNLTATESGATVKFENPFRFYGKLMEAVKEDGAMFTFIVSTGHKDLPSSCSEKDDICRQDNIPFPEGVEECVNLTGQLCNNDCLGQVDFNKTGPICLSKSNGTTEVHLVTLMLLLCVLVLVITIVTFLICKVKAWTMKVHERPKCLEPQLPNPRKRHPTYSPLANPVISPVTVSDHEPYDSCSVSSEEENRSAKHSSTTPLYVEGLSEDSNQELETLESSEGQRTDDDSVKTECISLEEEEEELSPYDSPQVMQVDMGDGDMVEAYTKR